MKTTFKLAALATLAAFSFGCAITDYNTPGQEHGNNTSSTTVACTGNADRASNGDANGTSKGAQSIIASMNRSIMRDGTVFEAGSSCGVGSALTFPVVNYAPTLVGKKQAKAWAKELGSGIFVSGISQLIGGQWHTHDAGTVRDAADACGAATRPLTLHNVLANPLVGRANQFMCYSNGSQDGASEAGAFGAFENSLDNVDDVAMVSLDHDGTTNGFNLNMVAVDPDAYAATGMSTQVASGQIAEGIQVHGQSTTDAEGALNLLAGGQAQFSVDGWTATVDAKLNLQTGNYDVNVLELGFDGQTIQLSSDAKVSIGADFKTLLSNWDEFGAGYAEALRFVADVLPADENGDFIKTIDSSTFAQLGLPVAYQPVTAKVNSHSMRDIADRMDDAAAGLGTDRIQLEDDRMGGFRRLR